MTDHVAFKAIANPAKAPMEITMVRKDDFAARLVKLRASE